ncbi:AsmA family protein [Aurantibacter crassamenti]|uniref:AsmA-like C-terminal region-containing protein n=1 Tax=Aurantibacter crassamenti TaxID=1837375 RepID=UPI00193A8B70|nr:AsmA-like C-terminal region-containing protein [Aurantibacter crassamenti]MBM1106053.1 AsmA family protein [Aurantibacter crassamenti]
MKKVFKIFGVVLLLLVILIVAAPFFLQGKIDDIIKNKVNENVNATLDFTDADLSLFSNFPNATVTLEKVSLINKAPFEGDTLFAANEVELKLGISQFFKESDEPIKIDRFFVDGANVNIKVDAEEHANYDIAKNTGTEAETTSTTSESSFTLAMDEYSIQNSKILYDDRSSDINLMISELNHSGTGDLSLATSELNTKTTALVSFGMDSTYYLKNHKLSLDALIGVDLEKMRFSFLKNEALVNQLPLVFDGFVQINDTNQEIDINFKTASSEFKNFLAVIPEEYSKSLDNIKTTGDFILAGEFKGIVDETHIPKFNIKVNSNNASFKYPDLPKTVRNIFIDVAVNNATGISADTYVDINKLSFMIDEDKFNMVSKLRDLTGNMKVDAQVDGKMNLANISKAYPVPADLGLKGLLDADIDANFDMASIEKKKYENTKIDGIFSLKDFEYNSEEMANPVKIAATKLTFTPNKVVLNELQGSTGKTDFNATGTIDNLLGFMFNDEKVKGDFDLNSNTFSLNDFMTADVVEAKDTIGETNSEPVASGEESLKIPSFLDCTINASAATVLYDNLTLKNVKGSLLIKDETATLKNMTSSMFDGKMGFNGKVSTKNEIPDFGMKLDIKNFKISETFDSFDLFKTLAPVAGILRGALDSEIEISGKLNDDFTPDMATISGDVLAELLQSELDPKKAAFLSKIGEKLSFLKPENLDLKGLKTALTFENGEVKVKPFTVKYQDINMNVSGSHTFDQKLNYAASIEVPAKYLGSEINSLIAKIDDSSLKDLTIPVTANIGGNYASPDVTTDLTGGVKSLTSKLVEIEKQKLINKGKDKAKDLLKGVLGSNKDDSEAPAENKSKEESAKEVLSGILGGNKDKETTETKADSTEATEKKEEQKEAVKEKAKDILGGFLGKKKKEGTN